MEALTSGVVFRLWE